ncbi:MAG TPA: hypothetical protein PLV59_00745 [Candidatus Dojkabacteria bacterium]|nr:hypothetical protein [Candidatus Dojkabacteria bacterium]
MSDIPASFPTPTEPALIPYTEKVEQELKEIGERSAFHGKTPRREPIKEEEGPNLLVTILLGTGILLIIIGCITIFGV